MSARTITGELGVYLTPYASIGPAELKSGTDEQVLRGAQICMHDMAPEWTRIGTARVVVELHQADDIVNGRVASLREEQTRVRAEAAQQVTKIEQEIQSLLAITYDEGGAA